MLLLLIIGFLLLLYALIILYYWRGWLLSGQDTSPIKHNPSNTFSIIIPSRNESADIKACLDSIQQLNYPSNLYQIIVVDDHSEDDTADIVKSYANITLLHLKDAPFMPARAHKKQAITLGISKSTYDYIVTTDADCTVPHDWLLCLDQMIQQQGSVCIAAPVVLEKPKGILQIFETLDFMMLQGITASAVHTGIHIMGNGANLCYRKSAFEAVKGFNESDQIASGDDMLLMQKLKLQFPRQVHYCLRKEAVVTTKGAKDFSSFLMQRIRWASKGKYYTEYKLKLILLVVFLFNLSVLVLMMANFFYRDLIQVTALVFAIKTMVELVFLYPVSHFFNRKKALLFFIPLQPLHVIYMVCAAFLGNFRKYTWKGRSVH